SYHLTEFLYSFSFFQAEDGILYFHVTGVQTWALPIYTGGRRLGGRARERRERPRVRHLSAHRARACAGGSDDRRCTRTTTTGGQIGRASRRESVSQRRVDVGVINV